MRLVDDFLVFTPCRASAEAVVRRVMRGASSRCYFKPSAALPRSRDLDVCPQLDVIGTMHIFKQGEVADMPAER